MTRETLAAKATAFRRLHERDGKFVMPNAWDAGTARFLEAAGFQAIATTSGGVNWAAGRRDYVYEVPADEMLEAYGQIAGAVDIPVSGDLENGYGRDPETVAATITRSVAYGMVGGGIEDSTGDPEQPLFERELAVERIRAAREAADATGISYTVTARCEVFCFDHDQPYAEAVERCNRFAEVGADCVFAPGLVGREAIRAFVDDVAAPVNMVVGLAQPQLSVRELEDLGVKRISTGGSLARASFGLIKRVAEDMIGQGEFNYLADAISDPDIDTFFRTGNHAGSA